MSTLSLVPSEYNGLSVSFNDQAWFNATHAAAHFGKRVDVWLKTKETQEYIAVLCDISNTTKKRYLKTKRENNGGTWIHPDLVVLFARWLDVRFAIWCDRQIRQIIAGSHPHFDWRKVRHAATSSNKCMAEALRIVREEAGKRTLAHHYSNECRLINWALTGAFSAVDRDALPESELAMLARLELRNSVLVGRGKDYQTRKALLREYAVENHHLVMASVLENKNTSAPAGRTTPFVGDVGRASDPSRG